MEARPSAAAAGAAKRQAGARAARNAPRRGANAGCLASLRFLAVTPAEAGVHGNRRDLATLDPGFRRDDERREVRFNLKGMITFKDGSPVGLR